MYHKITNVNINYEGERGLNFSELFCVMSAQFFKFEPVLEVQKVFETSLK